MEARGHHFRKPITVLGAWKYVMVAGPDDVLIELFEVHEAARLADVSPGISSL